MSGISIGKLAQRANIGVETVRYYERRGLIANPPRRPSGYRQYPPEAIDRLRFIRRALRISASPWRRSVSCSCCAVIQQRIVSRCGRRPGPRSRKSTAGSAI